MTDTRIGFEDQAPFTVVATPTPVEATSSFGNDGLRDSTASSNQTPSSQGVAGKVKERLVSTADDKKAGIADRLGEVADSLNRSSEQFAGKQDWIASAIARGGAELDTLASSLRDADVGDLLRQVQSFARRQPGVFIGVSLATGFAIARFGKIVAADVSRDDLPVMPEVGHAQH